MSIGDEARPNGIRQNTDADQGSGAALLRTLPSAATAITDGLQELTETAVTMLVGRVLDRQRETWRTAIDAAKSALADCERACDRLSRWDPAEATAEVSALVDALRAAAGAERVAAVERARAEARGRIDELEQHLGRLEAESADLRHRLGHSIVAQQEEFALRVRAETVGAKFQQMVAHCESQLQAARLQAESEHLQFESLRQQLIVSLTRALRDVQADDTSAVPGHGAPPPSTAVAVPLDAGRTGHDAVPASVTPTERHGLKLVTVAPAIPDFPSPEVLEHLTRLLGEVEAKYQADVAAHVLPLETVDRLTENLRAAREYFGAFAADSAAAAAMFKEHLIALVNARADSPFGRHLGISLYALYPPGDNAIESARRAS